MVFQYVVKGGIILIVSERIIIKSLLYQLFKFGNVSITADRYIQILEMEKEPQFKGFVCPSASETIALCREQKIHRKKDCRQNKNNKSRAGNRRKVAPES